MVRHVFVSTEGKLLPRWISAFPDALGCRFGQTVPSGSGPVLIWLRLSRRPVAQCLSEIRQQFGPDTACIVLSDIPRDDEAIACFAAAARGYCNSHAVSAMLRRVAEVVIQGGLWIGEGLMQRLLHVSVHAPPAAESSDHEGWDASLSKREREVAQLVATGSSNKEIARTLSITERTVKAHVSAVLSKLGVRDRLQLTLIANGHRSTRVLKSA